MKLIRYGLNVIDVKMKDILQEINLNIDDLTIRRESGYYNKIENILEPIKSFIKENERFPTQIEIQKDLKIHDYSVIGSLAAIKEILNYDKDDLIDSSSFINKSSYELIVANYLKIQAFRI